MHKYDSILALIAVMTIAAMLALVVNNYGRER